MDSKCFVENLRKNYKNQSETTTKIQCSTITGDDDDDDDRGKHRWASCIDDYNLLDLIGSGSFGRVFRSYCKSNGQECAIKCISKQNSRMNLDKILSEVYIHIRLCHPNILQLFTVLEDSKAVYLIMEICHGGSLSKLISERKRQNSIYPILPYELISSLLLQICDALDYLHRNSIVHRDINLNNILLTQPYHHHSEQSNLVHIKLADFGLAIDQKQMRHGHRSSTKDDDELFVSTICGTPGFISPEIWNQQKFISYKSDIFSLGSIIYACIAGHTPKGDIILDSFPPMAADLITRLLEHDPEKRLQIQQIKQHIFLAGRINTKRLHPIEKQTNTLQMSIDCDGNVMMHFRNDNLTINVCHNGLLVDISHHQSMDHEYNFYELPEKYWKHFLYVTKFINLVRSKTRKIIINCGDWLNKTNNRFDNSDSKKFINKCILMNDGHFEVNVYDGILNENSTYQLDEISKSLDHDLKQNVNKLYELYSTTMKLEQTLEIQSKKLGIDLFPITIGIDSKLFETSSSRLSENNSFLTSKILRSIPVNGIGHAIQFTNGSIKVNFDDGSDLCMDRDNRIFYLHDGILDRYHKDDKLPDFIVDKLTQLPQVIERLKIS
nr:serine/threonine-protein kinase PLK4-like [Dermatophagoides farinae]